MDWNVFTLRVLTALILGSLIGAERQMRQRMAGLRTNALVAAGACLFVTITEFTGDTQGSARIAAQVVSGIGFLGAGVIMREGLNVRGLNTAATLWCSAAIGVMIGLGYLLPGTIGTAAILAANVVLRGFAQLINRQSLQGASEVDRIYRLSIVCIAHDEVHVRTLMLHMLNGMPQLMIQSLHSEDLPLAGQLEVRADLIASPKELLLLEQIISRISLEKSVSAARWGIRDETNA